MLLVPSVGVGGTVVVLGGTVEVKVTSTVDTSPLGSVVCDVEVITVGGGDTTESLPLPPFPFPF